MLVANMHRERCSRCGKVFITATDKDWWRVPVAQRPAKLCPACELKATGSFVGGLFKRKK